MGFMLKTDWLGLKKYTCFKRNIKIQTPFGN